MADTFTTNLTLTKPEVAVATDWASSINTNLDTLDGQLPLSTFNQTTAPTANDDSGSGYAVGSRWFDTTADKYYVCVDATAASAVWQELIPASAIGTTVQAYDADTTKNDAANTFTATQTFSAAANFTGEIQLNASAGTSGQVLTSQGSGVDPLWVDPNTLVNAEPSTATLMKLGAI